jgi:hypothetical protein
MHPANYSKTTNLVFSYLDDHSSSKTSLRTIMKLNKDKRKTERGSLFGTRWKRSHTRLSYLTKPWFPGLSPSSTPGSRLNSTTLCSNFPDETSKCSPNEWEHSECADLKVNERQVWEETNFLFFFSNGCH